MRQKGEDKKRFKECLNNLADGNFSNEEKKDLLRNSTMFCSILQEFKQLGK